MKKQHIVLIAAFVSISMLSCQSADTSRHSENLSGDTIPKYAENIGESVLKLFPELWMMESAEKPRWSYTYGLVAQAMIDLSQYSGNDRYYAYAKAWYDRMIDENGKIEGYKISEYNIDHLNPGKSLFDLYKLTGEQKYKTALDTLRLQLNTHPQTAIGGFWHKKRYPHQMWLDGLYMGGPFYARYSTEYNETANFNLITTWYMNMEKVARDPATGLLYHGWDESRTQKWADPVTGCSPNFWGRGMGWYAMALVDLLDYLPENHAKYDSILAIVNRLSEAIVKVQDPETGTWFQVLNEPGREGNYREGSASSMFSYFLLKSVNKGYIDRNRFEPFARQAFEGILKNLVKTNADSTLVISPVCAVAGLGGDPYRDGSYDYYINEERRDNDPKAVGPLIMAAMQYEILLKKESE